MLHNSSYHTKAKFNKYIVVVCIQNISRALKTQCIEIGSHMSSMYNFCKTLANSSAVLEFGCFCLEDEN